MSLETCPHKWCGTNLLIDYPLNYLLRNLLSEVEHSRLSTWTSSTCSIWFSGWGEVDWAREGEVLECGCHFWNVWCSSLFYKQQSHNFCVSSAGSPHEWVPFLLILIEHVCSLVETSLGMSQISFLTCSQSNLWFECTIADANLPSNASRFHLTQIPLLRLAHPSVIFLGPF